MYYKHEESTHAGNPVELYQFTHAALSWHYTSASEDLTLLGKTWKSATIKRSAIKKTTDVDRSDLIITADTALDVARLFKSTPPTEPLMVNVSRTHLTDNSNVAALLFSGRVLGANWTDETVALSCKNIFAAIARGGLRRHYQRQCAHVLYRGFCRAIKTAIPATIVTAQGSLLTVATDTNYPLHFFAGGAIEWQNPLTREVQRRMILAYTPALQQIKLAAPLPDLRTGHNVSLYPGCTHELSDCRDRHDNLINYGGFPYMPERNPFGSNPLF